MARAVGEQEKGGIGGRMSAKLMTWADMGDRIADMTLEERRSPVLMCGDGWYVGICGSDIRVVPNKWAADTLKPLRKEHVKPGRTYIQL